MIPAFCGSEKFCQEPTEKALEKAQGSFEPQGVFSAKRYYKELSFFSTLVFNWLIWKTQSNSKAFLNYSKTFLLNFRPNKNMFKPWRKPTEKIPRRRDSREFRKFLEADGNFTTKIFFWSLSLFQRQRSEAQAPISQSRQTTDEQKYNKFFES